MRVPSNLPPGVTDSMIEEAQGEGGRAMNDSQIDEAEHRIGLHRDGLVDTLARLREALGNAQEVIHLSYCSRPSNRGLPCFKECREAQAALKAAEEAAS